MNTEPELRLPPANTAVEQALLGAIFRNNLAHSHVSDFLAPEHFSYEVHGRIYAAICKLIHRGQIANPVTLKNLFEQDAALAELGGAQYLVQLASSAVTIINAADYGRQILDLHSRRQLIAIGEDIVNAAYQQDLGDPATVQIERAEARLFDLAGTGRAESAPVNYGDFRERALRSAEERHVRGSAIVGVPTGFTDLDCKLGGLPPSHLIVLGAQTSMGKSSFALDIARNAACAGKRVLFFSLEMSGEDLANRNLAVAAGISADRISRGELAEADLARLVAPDPMLDRNLVIDETGGLSVAQIRARARRCARRGGLDLVVVDHLHLVQPDAGQRDSNRVRELARMTAGLETLAKELGVPVLLLSQLNRSVESRDDWKPRRSDLRESGSIEQDADIVLLLYRKSWYLDRLQPKNEKERTDLAAERAEWNGVAQILIEKNRGGATGAVTLRFDAELTTFENLSRAEVW